MGRTALYRDPVPFRPARAEVVLEADVLVLRMPDGRSRRHAMHGTELSVHDGIVTMSGDHRPQRRFVRMLILENKDHRTTLITPPERGAVAPGVVLLPEAPAEAAILDDAPFEALSEWISGGGRLGACAIADLARLSAIASPHFAVLIGEVAAQRALELVAIATGPQRGWLDVDTALQPLMDMARSSTRAAEALIAALAHVAGSGRRRRR
ncbi:MAG TPA: hypothetical protein VGM90_03135 [Kofleriaceae bacterium]|jgi:hypothetical protein